MATAPRLIEPPFYDPPIADFASGQQHSQAWTEYHQAVADRLAAITDAGVTDGSEATAGDVGEYMTAGSAAAAISSGVVTNIVALNLTPGDWDVSGFVAFTAGAGTHTYFGVGISVIDTSITATYPASAINQVLPTTIHRINITAATAVWLVAQAGFTGTMTAAGSIRGRRAR
jgi:hypothetical protein